MRGGEPAEVESLLTAAVGEFRELGTPFWTAMALLELGEWLIQQGRGEEARPSVEEAEGIFAALKASPWLERAARTAVGSDMTA
jgi:hypothetical protein